MRGLQLPLTQTQKIRLQRALEKLESLSLKANTNATVTIADTIPFNHDDGFLKYKPEVGDIVAGRVVEAEVRGLQHDGIHLQARSQKYGKLRSGQLLSVPPYLVKRRKQHLHHLDQLGVDLILGCNGFIWVGEHAEPKDDMAVDQENDTEQDLSAKKYPATLEDQERAYTPIETRQNICRIANAIRVASTLGFTIIVETITETFNLSTSLDIHEMLGSEFCVLVAEEEAERRGRTKRAG